MKFRGLISFKKILNLGLNKRSTKLRHCNCIHLPKYWGTRFNTYLENVDDTIKLIIFSDFLILDFVRRYISLKNMSHVVWKHLMNWLRVINFWALTNKQTKKNTSAISQNNVFENVKAQIYNDNLVEFTCSKCEKIMKVCSCRKKFCLSYDIDYTNKVTGKFLDN